MKADLEETLKAGFVVETQWVDIPYMNDFEDFTIDDGDTGAWKELPTYVTETLHNKNRKFVPILDAGIGPKGSPFYEAGKEIYIKENAESGEPYVGKVWPGEASFPDYTNPGTQEFWNNGFNQLFAKV